MIDVQTSLQEYRDIREELETAVLPLATSVDGRRFSFQTTLHGLELEAGGYVVLETAGSARLGHVLSLELDTQEGAAPGLPAVRIRAVRGEGVLLDGERRPFHDAAVRAAAPDEVARWLERVRPARAALAVGELALAPGVSLALDAEGFGRHTFLCGQSGSGKTYALGVLLERLLMETRLRVVILDPNSDYVRLGEIRDGGDAAARERFAAVAGSVAVRGGEGHAPLRVRFRELSPQQQAAVLRLDPLADREEYAELAAVVADGRHESLRDLADAERDGARRLTLRVRNLGVEGWGVWAREEPGSVVDALDDPAVRCLVIDTGSLATREEQALVAEAVLRGLWDRRAARRPVLLVVDEAHNVCPASPEDPLTALATEHAVRIAGEGRKFGIYMLVSTQRPQKVHENVLSQCDNLVLMRLNSSADGDFVAERFGFAPPGLVGLATDFRLGEALVAGKLASHPAVVRFGSRVAQEGGGDVDSGWAARRP